LTSAIRVTVPFFAAFVAMTQPPIRAKAQRKNPTRLFASLKPNQRVGSDLYGFRFDLSEVMAIIVITIPKSIPPG
jgi:hypothetical protein